MGCDFFEMENDMVEEKLLTLKEEYQKQKMSEEQLEMLRMKMEEADMENRKELKRGRMVKFAATAAVFIGAFIILPNTSATVAYAMERVPIVGQLVETVTFRDYEYEAERHRADIEVPEIKLDGQAADSGVQENLERTAEEINAEIQKITDELTEEFEAGLEHEEGYQDIVVKSEVLATTEDYFTLKLFCYQGAGSGWQWNYYYTIDLNTGERLQLKDIFTEGADYITPISESIKEQMRTRMSGDENAHYWLDDEIEELNFRSVTEETSFYINGEDSVVICFDEGEVAPMYMGAVEFEIPADVLADIRR